MSCFKSTAADRSPYASVGAFYPYFHSNVAFGNVRKILDNRPELYFFTDHIGVEFVFIRSAKQHAVAIVCEIIISGVGRIHKIRVRGILPRIFLDFRVGNVKALAVYELRHSLVSLQLTYFAELIGSITHKTLETGVVGVAIA